MWLNSVSLVFISYFVTLFKLYFYLYIYFFFVSSVASAFLIGYFSNVFLSVFDKEQMTVRNGIVVLPYVCFLFYHIFTGFNLESTPHCSYNHLYEFQFR